MSSHFSDTHAAIVLIVFNRPVHTAKVLSALAANDGAADSPLLIYSDAPRGKQDEEAVAAVRRLVREVTGFKTVTVVERQQNVGCSGNVLGAITETLERYDRCIVVEDDIETSPLFLSYLNQGLHAYATDERFYAIGAYTYPFAMPAHYKASSFMAQRHCSWGWATWKRAWERMDFNQALLDQGMVDKVERKSFAKACGADWLRTYDKVPSIWDLRVTYQAWKLGMYTLYPVSSFTRNIGKDGSGTNYDAGALNSMDTSPLADKLPIFDPAIAEDLIVRKAFLKPTRKPLWRKLAINVTKGLGLYDTLLERANRG